MFCIWKREDFTYLHLFLSFYSNFTFVLSTVCSRPLFEFLFNTHGIIVQYKRASFYRQYFIIPKLTPELDRVVIFRIHKNSELPSTDEVERIITTLFTLANVLCGIHRKVKMVLDYRYFTAAMLPILMSNFQKVYSMTLVSIFISEQLTWAASTDELYTDINCLSFFIRRNTHQWG